MSVAGLRAAWEKYGQKITLAALAGILTFVTGLYELANKAYDARRNRDTISYLSTLAVRDMERGEYDEADKYVASAEQIDVKSFTLITTRAALNTLKLVDHRWKTDKAVPEDTVFQLEDLGLTENEANFCMAMSAVTNSNTFYDDAKKYFGAVDGRDERLRLLKELRTISHIELPQISAATDDDQKTKVAGLVQRLKELDDQIRVAEAPRPLEFWKHPLKKQFANPMHTDVEACLQTLQSMQAALAPTTAAATPETVLTKIERIKKQLPLNSPLAAVAEDQLQRAYVQQQEAQSKTASSTSDLEPARLNAVALKQQGKYDEARKALQAIVDRYAAEKRQPDQTLYYSLFSLGLMDEYHYRDSKAAERNYAQAEQVADALNLKDANMANTLGYFYYRQARAEQDPTKRHTLIDNARAHLKRALDIDPSSSKGRFTLQGVEQLDNATKVATAPKPAA